MTYDYQLGSATEANSSARVPSETGEHTHNWRWGPSSSNVPECTDCHANVPELEAALEEARRSWDQHTEFLHARVVAAEEEVERLMSERVTLIERARYELCNGKWVP